MLRLRKRLRRVESVVDELKKEVTALNTKCEELSARTVSMRTLGQGDADDVTTAQIIDEWLNGEEREHE